jgi:hypothetical protein
MIHNFCKLFLFPRILLYAQSCARCFEWVSENCAFWTFCKKHLYTINQSIAIFSESSVTREHVWNGGKPFANCACVKTFLEHSRDIFNGFLKQVSKGEMYTVQHMYYNIAKLIKKTVKSILVFWPQDGIQNFCTKFLKITRGFCISQKLIC